MLKKRQGLDLKASALATLLTTKRHYCNTVGGTGNSTAAAAARGGGSSSGGGSGGGVTVLDPRYLAFEFTYDIVLRKAQVELLAQITSSVRSGHSTCRQMLMGGGKTTVVAPLLALLLADGKSLVMQVVPHALLEFSRDTMRGRFTALIQKTVFTFRFDRFTEASPALLQKLQRAAATRAIICATPTAVKSFALKFIELTHLLDQHALQQANPDNGGGGDGSNAALATMRKLGRIVKTGANSMFGGNSAHTGISARLDALGPQDIRKMRGEIVICTQIVWLLRQGVLLLDEVDLILHPLKVKKQPMNTFILPCNTPINNLLTVYCRVTPINNLLTVYCRVTPL